MAEKGVGEQVKNKIENIKFKTKEGKLQYWVKGALIGVAFTFIGLYIGFLTALGPSHYPFVLLLLAPPWRLLYELKDTFLWQMPYLLLPVYFISNILFWAVIGHLYKIIKGERGEDEK